MSWSPAEKIVVKSQAAVRASVVRFGKGGRSPARLSIILSQATYEALKKPKSFAVLIGHGENEGLIKLTAGGSEFVAGKLPLGGGVRVVITRPSWLADVARSAEACREEVADKTLIVTLPSAWRDAIPRGDHPRPLATNSTLRPGNVTSSLMGDPPPGRSALAQKR